MTENMRKYTELISKDEALRRRVPEFEDRLAMQSMENAVAIAAENGIALTPADFANSGELSDDELEGAAGGYYSSPSLCGCQWDDRCRCDPDLYPDWRDL